GDLDAVVEQRLGGERQREREAAADGLQLVLDLADQAARGVTGQSVRLDDLVLDRCARHPGLAQVDHLDDDRNELDCWQHSFLGCAWVRTREYGRARQSRVRA